MLEGEYRLAQGIGYIVLFISFIISVYAIPYISRYLSSKVQGLVLFLATYGIAFVLMMFGLPKLATMLINKR